jgi:HD-like signal output (HDOD) protein
MISIEELKARVNDLPAMPDLALRLLEMCRDPDVAPRDIVEVIRHEPAMTMQVLRLCNSTFYGLPRKVTSLQEAMIYIGTDALVNFVLAGHLSPMYRKRIAGYGLEPGQLWRHAVGSAICAQRVAEEVDSALAGSAFTCGLLHCIGKIILNTYVGEEFQRLLLYVEQTGAGFPEAEMKILGLSHAEAGAQIAEHWNLPDEIVESIRFYADPLSAPNHKKLVSIVHVGVILSMSMGFGLGYDGLAYVLRPGALDLLHMKADDMFGFSIEIHDRFIHAEELLNIA